MLSPLFLLFPLCVIAAPVYFVKHNSMTIAYLQHPMLIFSTMRETQRPKSSIYRCGNLWDSSLGTRHRGHEYIRLMVKHANLRTLQSIFQKILEVNMKAAILFCLIFAYSSISMAQPPRGNQA